MREKLGQLHRQQIRIQLNEIILELVQHNMLIDALLLKDQVTNEKLSRREQNLVRMFAWHILFDVRFDVIANHSNELNFGSNNVDPYFF